MKKIILVACLITGSIVTYGQSVSFGIKAGLNLAKQTISVSGVSLNSDSKADFLAGVYLTAMISENFGIQPELLYTGNGGDFDGTKLNLSYISVPVLARYQITPLFNIHAGPQLGILMSAKADGDDVKDSFNTTDFGLAVGAGLDFPMGLNVSVRYSAGLTNIVKESGDGTEKNNAFQFTLGYKLFGK